MPVGAKRTWLLLGTAWLSGCAGQPARPASGSTLTLSVRSDVTGFYPHDPFTYETFTFEAHWGLYDGLVRFNRHFEIEPGLAERWESPSERSLVFELRRGLRFSDGRPLTVEDVVASLQRARTHPATSHLLEGLESASALGPQRVQLQLKERDATLLYRLPWVLIVPAEVGAETPPGTGPYRLEAWSPGREFTLVPNDHFRGPRAAYERVRFEVVPDEAERLARVIDGRSDVADSLDPAVGERLRAQPGLRVVSSTGTFVLFLLVRVDGPPFHDRRVREALDAALDRDRLVERVFSGRALPASQVVAPGIVGFVPELSAQPRNLPRARRLLREAGHPDGLALRLDGTANRYVNDARLLGEVVGQLREAGFRVELNALDKERFFPLLFSGESRFHMVGWACDSGEASILLRSVFRSGAPGNTTGLADAELDGLIASAGRAARMPELVPRLQEAVTRIARERFAVPLVVQTETLAISRRIAWDPPRNFALRYWEMKPAETPSSPR